MRVTLLGLVLCSVRAFATEPPPPQGFYREHGDRPRRLAYVLWTKGDSGAALEAVVLAQHQLFAGKLLKQPDGWRFVSGDGTGNFQVRYRSGNEISVSDEDGTHILQQIEDDRVRRWTKQLGGGAKFIIKEERTAMRQAVFRRYLSALRNPVERDFVARDAKEYKKAIVQIEPAFEQMDPAELYREKKTIRQYLVEQMGLMLEELSEANRDKPEVMQKCTRGKALLVEKLGWPPGEDPAWLRLIEQTYDNGTLTIEKNFLVKLRNSKKVDDCSVLVLLPPNDLGRRLAGDKPLGQVDFTLSAIKSGSCEAPYDSAHARQVHGGMGASLFLDPDGTVSAVHVIGRDLSSVYVLEGRRNDDQLRKLLEKAREETLHQAE